MFGNGFSAWHAAAVGAVLGAVVAVVVPLSREPHATPEPPLAPRSPGATASISPGASAAVPPPSQVPAPPGPSSGPLARASEPPTASASVAEWELPAPPPQPVEPRLACARGAADACARVAFELASRPERKHEELLAYRSQAVVAYAERCRARQPVACVALARIHELGLGVTPDPAQAEALRARARELCAAGDPGRAGCGAPR